MFECPPKVRRVLELKASDGSNPMLSLPDVPQQSMSATPLPIPMIPVPMSEMPVHIPPAAPLLKTPLMMQAPMLTINAAMLGIPTVVRSSTPEITCNGTPQSSIEMQGEMVQSAVLNLPEVVNEVFQMQKGQSSEIMKQKNILEALKVKVKEAREKNDEVMQEISGVMRKTYLAEEESRSLQVLCKENEIEINILVSDCEQQNVELAEVQRRLKEEKDKQNVYRIKMSAHKAKVLKYERESAIGSELALMEERINVLQNQKSALEENSDEMQRLLSGSIEQELKEEVAAINVEADKLRLELKAKEAQAKDQNGRQKHIEQAINVLHKRNAAQLTCLKRQLKEAQSRNRHWGEQSNQLRSKIAELKQTLEE